jgi:hypothetical protein
MDLDSIVAARIHPAIGIARVGNAKAGKDGTDYFIGPEVPNRTPAPDGGYRDRAGRLKRQAARFRIYGYDRQGRVIGELTDRDAEIEWHVHVANKKAAWYNFDGALDVPEATVLASLRRNAQIAGAARSQLAIDPGSRSVLRGNLRACFDTGMFFGVPVYLGEIRYAEGGRLLFLGGRGESAPASTDYALTTFANNPGWHDDTSDGPVAASVRIGGREIPVDSAWVVTAPPNYAPDLVATQPLYDVIVDALQLMVVPEKVPSFTRHILPIFRQFQDSQWVNAGFATMFGFGGLTDFTRAELIQNLATAPVKRPNGVFDPFQELRFQIFHAFRNPAFQTFEPEAWPPLYGDVFGFPDDSPSPRAAFAITELSYKYLQSWMLGNFVADYNPNQPDPQSIDDVPLQRQPDTLDEAALHFCIGGPFHPGCEMTWPMRHISLYRDKFRLQRRPAGLPEPDYGEVLTPDIALADGGPLSASGPGDLTRWMAVPWQADTASCRAGYGLDFPEKDVLIPAFWPSRVPNTVLSEDSYRVVIDRNKPDLERWEAFFHRDQWAAPLDLSSSYVAQINRMIDHFHELGVLERREYQAADAFPEVMYVQVLPPQSPPVSKGAPVSNYANLMRDVITARAGRARRRS